MRALASFVLVSLWMPVAFAQTVPPAAPQPVMPTRPVNPVAAPHPGLPSSSTSPARPANPDQPNPAAAPVHPISSAGATERGMAPVEPTPGVTRKVDDAAQGDVDGQGRPLDNRGQPVGQAPVSSSSR